MSRAGAAGLLVIILAACAFSLLLTPGLHGLIASSVLLALWIVVAGAGLVHGRRRVPQHGEGS